MLKGWSTAATVAASMIGAGSVAAQTSAPAAQPVRAIYDAGRCIARHRAAAAELLQILPIGGGVVGDEAQRIVASRGCDTSALEGDAAILLRGAIAQELYLHDFREFGVEPRNRGAWINMALPVQADADNSDDANTRLYRWADCVVRNDTVRTERLFKTQPGSRQETQALQSMQPYMSACLDPDTQIAVASSELRSLFAQGAYHNSYRYWTGELRQAGAEVGRRYNAVGEGSVLNVVRCQRLNVTGSNYRTHKICMREGEWRRLESHIRESTARMLRHLI
jgi:hypothetical protein